MSLNHDLSDQFERMAALMEIRGDNAFKVIAFQKVSRLLHDLTSDVREAVENGTLAELPGIGKSSQRIIEAMVKQGRSQDYDDLAASVPAGLVPMLNIEGLGPKTIAMLWKERAVTSTEDLKAAIAAGKLEGLKGLGAKKIAQIAKGLEHLEKRAGRRGIGEVMPVAEELVERLRQVHGVAQAEIAGSLRRRRDTIGDVDILAAVKDMAATPAIAAAFVKFPGVERVLAQGETKTSVVAAGGIQVDLRLVPVENFGAALQYFTGSKEHNVKLRERARGMGMTLSEWGLYRQAEYDRAAKKPAAPPSAKPVASRTEPEIYAHLEMSFVEPELREDRGEVEAAIEKRLPVLVTSADLRGDLHCHTTASDGVNSIEEMARAAMARGYEYLAITDHSHSSVIANGLDARRLLAHIKEIHRIGEQLKGITLLAGSEVDILADGHLDYEDAVLAELDLVIASPHVALTQEPAKATDRLLRAIEHRYVNIIGHPTGRLINQREGLSPDFGRLFKAAAANATVMEINAGAPRLDLDDIHSRAAVAAGVRLAINTDAHSAAYLAGIDMGLAVARRGWVESKSILNCLSVDDLRRILSKKR